MDSTLYDRIKSGEIVVPRRSPPEVRFWKYVDKNGPIHPTLGQCWRWLGGRERFGYGMLRGEDKSWRAHRFSYRIHFGSIPDGLCVLHRCDNPPCANPEHLFVGTRVDNNLDRYRKGRGGDRKGLRNGRARLTDAQVVEIRQLYRRGSSEFGQKALAKLFGVCSSTIGYVVTGQHWGHI